MDMDIPLDVLHVAQAVKEIFVASYVTSTPIVYSSVETQLCCCKCWYVL